MGLDQYGGWLKKPTKEEEVHAKLTNDYILDGHEEFEWRKHAKLQKFMEDIWYSRESDGSVSFNAGQRLYLNQEDILNLQQLILNDDLPESEGGFFYGHQFQDEAAKENKLYDLKFCHDALEWLSEGKQVFYECSW